MSNIDPRLQGFILFCVARRGNKWPALYDEIAIVAGQRLYHGMGYAELRQMGLCLGLENIEKTRELIRLATAPCG